MPPEERSVELANKHGLHARPISRIIEVANRYEAHLVVHAPAGQADGRSVFELMTLSAAKGSRLTFRAEGEDASSLLEELVQLVEGRFGEEA